MVLTRWRWLELSVLRSPETAMQLRLTSYGYMTLDHLFFLSFLSGSSAMGSMSWSSGPVGWPWRWPPAEPPLVLAVASGTPTCPTVVECLSRVGSCYPPYFFPGSRHSSGPVGTLGSRCPHPEFRRWLWHFPSALQMSQPLASRWTRTPPRLGPGQFGW